MLHPPLLASDMFFIVRQDGRWLVVADQFSEFSDG